MALYWGLLVTKTNCKEMENECCKTVSSSFFFLKPYFSSSLTLKATEAAAEKAALSKFNILSFSQRL